MTDSILDRDDPFESDTETTGVRTIVAGDTRVLNVRQRVRTTGPVSAASEAELAVKVEEPSAEPAKNAEEHSGEPAPKPKPSTGAPRSARAADKAKKKPSGDYPVGYCRPPVQTRFDGTRPGPGRPPGAASQDTLLKKHLTQVRPVAIEGRRTRMQNRELVLAMRMKEALSGNRHAADYVLAQAARLFSERENSAGGAGAQLPDNDDAHDRAILATFEAALLARAHGDLAPDMSQLANIEEE